MRRGVTVSLPSLLLPPFKSKDPARHFLIFPLPVLSSFALSIRFSPATCSLSRRLLSSVTGSPPNQPEHKEKRSQTLVTQTHSHWERTSQSFSSPFGVVFFFLILTQILSVLSSALSHDSICRRNSGRREERGGSAQGLGVEERAGGDGVEGKREGGRERGRDGESKGSGN